MRLPITLLLITIATFSCRSSKSNLNSKKGNTILHLENNNLISLPDSTFSKKNLTHLFAGLNGWMVISPVGTTGALPNRNRIHYLPEKICQLSELRLIDLSANDIDTLPDCFSNLQNLESLDLSYNNSLNIRQSIPVIAKLKNLKELKLHLVPQALTDSSWVQEQFLDRKIKISVTTEHMAKYYGRH
jgi:Leucine-rich repeat (LRR) protein